MIIIQIKKNIFAIIVLAGFSTIVYLHLILGVFDCGFSYYLKMLFFLGVEGNSTYLSFVVSRRSLGLTLDKLSMIF